MKEIPNNCSHYYEYSHKEQHPIINGTEMKDVDVVLCTKCGNTKRV